MFEPGNRDGFGFFGRDDDGMFRSVAVWCSRRWRSRLRRRRNAKAQQQSDRGESLRTNQTVLRLADGISCENVNLRVCRGQTLQIVRRYLPTICSSFYARVREFVLHGLLRIVNLECAGSDGALVREPGVSLIAPSPLRSAGASQGILLTRSSCGTGRTS